MVKDFGQLPKVERMVWLPVQGEQQLVQGLITNDLDFTTGIEVDSFATVFKGNPKVTTYSGQKLPYGNMDWWPTSLYVNTLKEPYNNKDFRWALSYLIDRDQLIKVGWNGASEKTQLPMPNFPALKPFVDAAKPLLDKYPTNEFNPDKGHAMLDEARLEEGQRRHVRGSDGQAVHAGHHRKLRLPVAGPGAGRAPEAAGHRRHLLDAA